MMSFGVMTLSFLFLITFSWFFLDHPKMLGSMWVGAGCVGLFIAICELIGSPRFGLGDFLGRLFIVGVLVFTGLLIQYSGGSTAMNAKTGEKETKAVASEDLYQHAVRFNQRLDQLWPERYTDQPAGFLASQTAEIRKNQEFQVFAYEFAYHYLDFVNDYGEGFWFYDDITVTLGDQIDDPTGAATRRRQGQGIQIFLKEQEIEKARSMVWDIYERDYSEWKQQHYGIRYRSGRPDPWKADVDPSDIGFVAPSPLSERDQQILEALKDWEYNNGPWRGTRKEWVQEHY